VPFLRRASDAAALAMLLVLGACGRAQPVAAPPAANDSPIQPIINESATPATMSPSQSPGPVEAEPAPDEGGGPRDRFVVCPGNPRCPPDASQPKGGRGN
jgi:predicted small lipoprotein YifL